MSVTEFEIEIIKAIQSIANPVFDGFAEAVTVCAEQYTLIPVLVFIFWCVNKDLGYWLCWNTIFLNAFSSVIKCITMVPRPIGVEGIRTIRAQTATGYSFPSSHTATITDFLISAAVSQKSKKLWIIAIFFPILVGFSRVYLGCHWITDVIGGYALGIIFPILFSKIYPYFKEKKYLLFIISAADFIPLFFILDGYLLDFCKIFGLLCGFSVGSFFETKYVDFKTDVPVKNKVFRFIVGILSILVFYLPMKLILPENNICAFIRYFAVAFDAVFIAPVLFKRLKL